MNTEKVLGLRSGLSSLDLPNLHRTRKDELTENHDAISLIVVLKSEQVTAEEDAREFLRRVALAQKLVCPSSPATFDPNRDQAANLFQLNCTTELIFDEAITRARCLDSLPDSVPRAAFHGFPISVNIYLGMNDKTNHSCFVKRIGEEPGENTINEIFCEAGWYSMRGLHNHGN
jgi:amidase